MDIPRPLEKFLGWIPPAFLTILFAVLLRWSWQKWTDPLVDFGRELYVPWRLSLGEVLYRDVAHLFGPLSAYVNGVLFALFGPSLSVLLTANGVFLAIFVALLYHLISKNASQLAAWVSGSLVLVIFAFSQYFGVASYNFMSPYSHEATHGSILSAAMVWLLWRFWEGRGVRDLLAAGGLYGLVFLTKVDILVAASLALGAFLAVMAFELREPGRWLRISSLFCLGALAPLLIAFLGFSTVMPPLDAARAVCGSWIHVLGSGVSRNLFYLNTMGLDAPWANLRILASRALFLAGGISVLLFASHRLGRAWGRPAKGRPLSVLSWTLVVILPVIALSQVHHAHVGRLLPVTTLLAVLGFARTVFQDPSGPDGHGKRSSHVFWLLWSCYSMGLLLKVLLAARLIHYGFYLALPATVLFVCLLLVHVPSWLERNGDFQGKTVFQGTAVLALAVLAMGFWRTADMVYREKTLSMGAGGDEMLMLDPRLDSRGIAVELLAEWLRQNTGPQETVVVIPEGVMVNYLARRANPTPFNNFMVPEVLIFGEEAMLEALQHAPPDHIVAVHRSTEEYGFEFFGQDVRYGQRTMEWIETHYERVHQMGGEPFEGRTFGFAILRRLQSGPGDG